MKSLFQCLLGSLLGVVIGQSIIMATRTIQNKRELNSIIIGLSSDMPAPSSASVSFTISSEESLLQSIESEAFKAPVPNVSIGSPPIRRQVHVNPTDVYHPKNQLMPSE